MNMKKLIIHLMLNTFIGLLTSLYASPVYKVPEIKKKEYQGPLKTVSQDLANEKGCLSCHQGIEDIRDPKSMMMVQIVARGKMAGDPGELCCLSWW